MLLWKNLILNLDRKYRGRYIFFRLAKKKVSKHFESTLKIDFDKCYRYYFHTFSINVIEHLIIL